MTVTPKVALAAVSAAALVITAAPGLAKKPAARPKRAVVVSSSRAERSLAGVRLGTKASTLFRLFGQPNEIQVGAGTGSSGTTDQFGGGGEASPFGGGAFPTPGGGGVQTLGPGTGPALAPAPVPMGPISMPGGPPMPGGPSGMPLPMPGGPGMEGGAFPGAGGTTDTTGGPLPTMTYIYHNFRGHKGLEMTIQMDEDGRVVQIIGTSLKPVYGVGTSRGIGFGSSYKAVIDRYAWPESQTSAGNFIQASYQERAHVAFQFLSPQTTTGGPKVVRIVVAEVE